MIGYDSGREFFYDLLVTFGIEDGIKAAKTYLDLPSRQSVPGEMDFCRELYQAMIQYENQLKSGKQKAG